MTFRTELVVIWGGDGKGARSANSYTIRERQKKVEREQKHLAWSKTRDLITRKKNLQKKGGGLGKEERLSLGPAGGGVENRRAKEQ